MASLAYNHGVIVTESSESPVIPRFNRFGTVGVIGHASDADANEFPLNKPVLLLASRFTTATLGTEGTLPIAIATLISEGCSHMIVVRVEEGVDTASTKANIIGALGSKTGVYAWLNSLDLLDIKPRVLIAPGYTTDFIDDGVASVAITNGGTGYTTASASITGGDGTGAVLGDPVIEAGIIVSVPVLSGGSGYTAGSLVITGDGADAAGTLNFGDVMNPVVQALGVVAHDRSVTARAYVDGPGTTDVQAVAFRNTINNDRIMVIDPPVLQYDTESATNVQRPGATVFAGVRARVATEDSVSESVSNKDTRSIVGVARTVRYGDEANYLNERQVSTFIRRPSGGGGFRTWGSRLATDKSIWQFDSVRATADFINEAIERTVFEFVDRRFSEANLVFLINAIRAIMEILEGNGDILRDSWSVTIDRERSTPEDMANGRIWLSVQFEPPAIMEDIRIITYRNIAAYSILLDNVQGIIEDGVIGAVA